MKGSASLSDSCDQGLDLDLDLDFGFGLDLDGSLDVMEWTISSCLW